LRGGESEDVRCTIFGFDGAGARVNLGAATATVSIKQKFTVELLGIAPEVPSGNDLGVVARIAERLPTGAKVTWDWRHSGVGSITRIPGDDNLPNSQVRFSTTDTTEGLATFSVWASVEESNGTLTLVLPVTKGTQVKRGLREVTMEAFGGIFACTDTRACGVPEYTAFIVPRMSKAIRYSAVLSGPPPDPYGCYRTVTWTAPIGDGGGCRFPVTYHPHNSSGPTDAWAVWIGFGGPIGPGVRCMVTITLSP
jgi:hypothetical protein